MLHRERLAMTPRTLLLLFQRFHQVSAVVQASEFIATCQFLQPCESGGKRILLVRER